MANRATLFAAMTLLALSACGDKVESDLSKAKENFMTEQQKLLEQAKEVGKAAGEVVQQQKKALEEMQDK